jgi:hypothetical protein
MGPIAITNESFYLTLKWGEEFPAQKLQYLILSNPLRPGNASKTQNVFASFPLIT